MTWFEWASLFLLVLSGVVTPIVLAVVLWSRRERNKRVDDDKKALYARLDHIDTCLDSVKMDIASKYVTKTDLSEMRTELGYSMTQLRTAITTDQGEIRERIYRLESNFMGIKG